MLCMYDIISLRVVCTCRLFIKVSFQTLSNNLITMDDILSVKETPYKTYEKCICLELQRNKKSSDIYLRTEVCAVHVMCTRASHVAYILYIIQFTFANNVIYTRASNLIYTRAGNVIYIYTC